MSPGEPESLKHLFERARELPPEDQAAFLEDACADDPKAQAELKSLLAAAKEAEGYFDSLADAVLSIAPWSEDEPSSGAPGPTDPDPMIGRTVRQYRIEEVLGRGGMGVVYRAFDTSLKRPVALKFLPRHLTGDEAATERFRVEAQAAAALDHSNVCVVHEIGKDDDGRVFIAMAYYEGETLQQKLERGPLPIDEAWDYARQIAAGLGAAHAHDIVHRDIKPGNVIVTSEGVAKVLDFGLAKLTDVTLTRTGTTLGTVAYMSPEQARGEEADHRTDLWSLGVVLYEMLTGERPFKGESTAVVLHAIQHEDPKPPTALRPDIPSELVEVISRLLAKNPDDRPPSVAATGLDGGETTRPDWNKAGAGKVRRRAASAAAIIVLVALGGWWFTRSPGGTNELRDASAISDLRPSLAVLPFANRGPPEGERFVTAVFDEIVTRISSETEIRLASRTSVEAYRETPKSVREIGNELDVRYVLEGGLNADSGWVRLNLTLIDAANEAHLWSQVFERETMGSRVDLQTELARIAAARVQVEILQAEYDRFGRLSTNNDEAYALYLRHRNAVRPYSNDTRTRVEMHLAGIELLEEAVRLDPDFGWAYMFLGGVQRGLYFRYDRAPERAIKAKEALERATELFPGREYLSEGWASYYAAVERDYDRAIQEYERARDPLGGSFLLQRAFVEFRAGRSFEAIESAREAAQRNPTLSEGVRTMGLFYHMMRRYDEALAYYDSALANWPRDPLAGMWRAFLRWHRDGDREAVRELARGRDWEWWQVLQGGDWERALEMRPGEQSFTDEYYVIPRAFDRGLIHLAAADSSSARVEFETAIDTLVARLELAANDDRVWRQLAWSYALLGQRDEALTAGRRALELMPPERDAFIGPTSVEAMAGVFGAVGPADSALVYFDRLLSTPGPIWLSARDINEWIGIDLIRRDPRFAELLRAHGLN